MYCTISVSNKKLNSNKVSCKLVMLGYVSANLLTLFLLFKRRNSYKGYTTSIKCKVWFKTTKVKGLRHKELFDQILS